MKTRPEDLSVMNDFIFPSISGGRRFLDVTGTPIHVGYAEHAVFQALLSAQRPQCAIEVGTETGVTLALIARHSTRAISIDIDPQVKVTLAPQFNNVEFITGSSHDVLPVLLKRLADEGTTPDFMFIDGDHSADGVRKDIEHVLAIKPTRQLVVLMHDTFNPGCRQGIASAGWSKNPYCHYVDLDFCPGVLHPNDNCLRQMWGGLGYALFLPEPRRHQLEVKLSHQLLFEAAFLQSAHCNRNRR